MRAIIIGAGRGSRLEHRTEIIPKTLVEVMGRPMLDWILEALEFAGFSRDQVVFISGYAEEVIKQRYPDLQIVTNHDWPNNNILASLLCAREFLREGFVSTYADIVYEPGVVSRLVQSECDFALGCDTRWLERYRGRSKHPSSDAEKMRIADGKVLEISRRIPDHAAGGEFIGVMKVSPVGASKLIAAYDEAAQRFAGCEFREGRSFAKAYLIDLLQRMLESGIEMGHANTAGGYMEIDTLEDLAFAEQWYASWP